MTVAYEIGTKFLNKSFETGLATDYVLVVSEVTVQDDEYGDGGGFTYHDEHGYGVNHDWVEFGYVEVI